MIESFLYSYIFFLLVGFLVGERRSYSELSFNSSIELGGFVVSSHGWLLIWWGNA